MAIAETKTVLGLVEAIYDAALDRFGWPTVLGRISAASGGHSALMRLVDCRREEIGFVAASGYDPHLLEAYRNYFVHLDPYRAHLAAAPVGALLVNEEVAPLAQRCRTEYFADYERLQDSVHAVGVPLARERDFLLYLGLQRGMRAGPYREHDLALIRCLLPHLLRAVQIQRLLGDAVEARALREAALERLGLGVVLLDSVGAVCFANSAAIAFAGRFGVRLGTAGLRVPGVERNGRCQKLIADALAAPSLAGW